MKTTTETHGARPAALPAVLAILALVISLSPGPLRPAALAETPATLNAPAQEAAHQGGHGNVERATVQLVPLNGSGVTGTLELRQAGDELRIEGVIAGLEPGDHGFHVHQYGDLSAADGSATGDHFAPRGHRHGGPDEDRHHAGDLGNITAAADGRARVSKATTDLRLDSVIGRALVVHQGRDDLESQPSGGAGDPAAAGVIGIGGSG